MCGGQSRFGAWVPAKAFKARRGVARSSTGDAGDCVRDAVKQASVYADMKGMTQMHADWDWDHASTAAAA
jgi:hypothetical protein